MTNIDIREYSDELLICAVRARSLGECLTSALVTTGAVALMCSFVIGRTAAAVIAIPIALLSFVSMRRRRKFTLRVSRQVFSAVGKVGDNLGDSRSVRAADVKWLEYQEDTTGPETGNHPGGLYAVLKYRSVCLLPDVDEQQTHNLIEKIQDKYPELGRQWASESPFGNRIISLGLSDESL